MTSAYDVPMGRSSIIRVAIAGSLLLSTACRLDEFGPAAQESTDPAATHEQPELLHPKPIRIDGWWTWLGCEQSAQSIEDQASGKSGDGKSGDGVCGWTWFGCMPSTEKSKTSGNEKAVNPRDGACEADEFPGQLAWVDGFLIDETEVTVEQYAACVAEGSCQARNLAKAMPKGWGPPKPSQFCNWGRPGREKHPINCVTWYEADHYCNWRKSRLPSEREWERAARGLGFRRFPWGDDAPAAASAVVANLADESLAEVEPDMDTILGYRDGYPITAPAGSFPAGRSPSGVLDLAGNVWEWTGSAYLPYPGNRDGQVHGQTNKRLPVMRGGSWLNPANRARCANRGTASPFARDPTIGFRCAMDLDTL